MREAFSRQFLGYVPCFEILVFLGLMVPTYLQAPVPARSLSSALLFSPSLSPLRPEPDPQWGLGPHSAGLGLAGQGPCSVAVRALPLRAQLGHLGNGNPDWSKRGAVSCASLGLSHGPPEVQHGLPRPRLAFMPTVPIITDINTQLRGLGGGSFHDTNMTHA